MNPAPTVEDYVNEICKEAGVRGLEEESAEFVMGDVGAFVTLFRTGLTGS